MDWFYANESDVQIKFQEDEFSSLVASGKIKAKTLVWNKTMADWQQASLTKPELFQSIEHTLQETKESSSQPNIPVNYQSNPQIGGYYSPPSDGVSVAAMVLGILGVTTMCVYGIGFFPAVAAVICGHLSKKDIRDTSGQPKYSGLALAGIIMGYVVIGIILLLIVVFFLFFGLASLSSFP